MLLSNAKSKNRQMYKNSSLTPPNKNFAKHVLNYQLSQIAREQKTELKFQNNVKQRFRNKYGGHLSNITTKRSVTRMYEPLQTGFCYKRDGTVKNNLDLPHQENATAVQGMVDLLFTNGEVDIEKILCLHLLSTHPCEALRPPCRSHKALSFLAREQSPLERLIERSRARQQRNKENDMTNLLPTYVLNLKKSTSKTGKRNFKTDCLIRDGRLAKRLIINDNINYLVQAVLEALQRTNPAKMTELLIMSKDPEKLKDIVQQTHIQNFLKALKGIPLLSSCESFHLSRPFQNSVPIEVQQPSESLEKLVTEIRQNVLRIPKDQRKKSTQETSTSNSPRGFEKYEEAEYPFSAKSGFFDVERLAIMLSNKIRVAHERDVKEYRRSLAKELAASYMHKQRDGTRSTSRRSLCAACSERWKQRSPTPRLSYSKRNKVTGVDPSILKCFLSKSTYMITQMIKDEEQRMDQRTKINQMENKNVKKEITKPKVSESTRRSSYLMRKAKNYSQFYGLKPIDPNGINNINLAKIKNQISVKENVRKVKKFLEEPLLDNSRN